MMTSRPNRKSNVSTLHAFAHMTSSPTSIKTGLLPVSYRRMTRNVMYGCMVVFDDSINRVAKLFLEYGQKVSSCLRQIPLKSPAVLTTPRQSSLEKRMLELTHTFDNSSDNLAYLFCVLMVI